jgi:hypothetical protein
MPRLDQGIADMKKVRSRESGFSTQLESCLDIDKSVQAKTERFRPRVVNLTNFRKQQPRDERMMKTSDWQTNILLENTKEERELEIKAARSMSKQMTPLHFYN